MALDAGRPCSAKAQSTDRDLENIIVTGTRMADRSVTETAVPVDVVTAVDLDTIPTATP